MSGAAAAADLSGVFATSDAGEREARRRRAMTRAETLLDDLDALKAALLSGRAPAAVLARLRDGLGTPDCEHGDAVLAALIGEIETRAAVELAKLGR